MTANAPEMNPQEFDVVRLTRALPDHGLPAGAEGTVVKDYTEHSGADAPAAYEVEFNNPDGFPRAVVTVAREDLDVVWRSSGD